MLVLMHHHRFNTLHRTFLSQYQSKSFQHIQLPIIMCTVIKLSRPRAQNASWALALTWGPHTSIEKSRDVKGRARELLLVVC